MLRETTGLRLRPGTPALRPRAVHGRVLSPALPVAGARHGSALEASPHGVPDADNGQRCGFPRGRGGRRLRDPGKARRIRLAEDGLHRTHLLQGPDELVGAEPRSEEHTSELQSLMRISYAVFCLKKKKKKINNTLKTNHTLYDTANINKHT